MLDFLIFAAVAALALFGLVFYLYPGSSRTTTIPGLDPSDLKDGNLGDIGKAGSLHQFLMKLHGDYGPIASFYWGTQLTVSISSPQLFKEHSKVFDRPVSIFSLFEPLISPHSLQYANGVEGRTRRRVYDGAFSHTAMLKYYSVLEEMSKDFAGQLRTIPKDDMIPLVEYMVTFAVGAIAKIGFGDYFDQRKAKDLLHSYEICWTEMELRCGGDMPSPDDPREERLQTELTKIKKLITGAISHRRSKDAVTGDDQALIDLIIDNSASEEVRCADVLTYMIGGFHTTGTLLAWIMYYLCSHRDVEARLVQELKDVLGDGGISPSNQKDLIYTRQVIDEALRCSVLAPYAARYQEMDSELGGHIIPEKTPVIHALGVSFYNEEYWPQPEKFDPDRFQDKPASFSFEPFGFAGKRKCPAYNFSYVEIMIFLSIVLPKFQFHLHGDTVVVPVHGLVTKPADEIWVRVEKRSKKQ